MWISLFAVTIAVSICLYVAAMIVGSVRDVVGILCSIISGKLIIAYYAARSNC
jgi:hypothetical protein